MDDLLESPLSPTDDVAPYVDSDKEDDDLYTLDKLITELDQVLNVSDLNSAHGGDEDVQLLHSDVSFEDYEDDDDDDDEDDGIRFVCFVCERMFPDNEFEQFQTHVTSHCFNCFKCFHCDSYYDTVDTFEQHLQKVPENVHLLEQSMQYIQRWAAIYCMLIKQNSLRRKDIFKECHAFCKVCRALDIDQKLPKKPKTQMMLDNYDMLNHFCHHMGYFRYVCLLCADHLPNEKSEQNSLTIDQLIDISITQPHSHLIKQHLLKYHCNDFFAYDDEQPIFQRYMFIGFIERNLIYVNKESEFDFNNEKELYKKSDIDELLRCSSLEVQSEEYTLDDSVFDEFLMFGQSENLTQLDDQARIKFLELHSEVAMILKNNSQKDLLNDDSYTKNESDDKINRKSRKRLNNKSSRSNHAKRKRLKANFDNNMDNESDLLQKPHSKSKRIRPLRIEIDNSSDLPQSSNKINVKVSTKRHGHLIEKHCQVSVDKLCHSHQMMLLGGEEESNNKCHNISSSSQYFYGHEPVILKEWAQRNHLYRHEDQVRYFDSLNSFALTDHNYFYTPPFLQKPSTAKHKLSPEDEQVHNIQHEVVVETVLNDSDVYDDEVERSPVTLHKSIRFDAKVNGDSLDYDSLEEMTRYKLHHHSSSYYKKENDDYFDDNHVSNIRHTNGYPEESLDTNFNKSFHDRRKRKYSQDQVCDDDDLSIVKTKSVRYKESQKSSNDLIPNGHNVHSNGWNSSNVKSKMILIDKYKSNNSNKKSVDLSDESRRKRSKKSKKHKRKKDERDDCNDSRKSKKSKKKRKKDKKEHRNKEKDRKSRRKSPDVNNRHKRYYHEEYKNGDVGKNGKVTRNLTTMIEPVKIKVKKLRNKCDTLFDTSNSDNGDQVEYRNGGINVKMVTDMLQQQPPRCSKNDDDDDAKVDQELMELGTKLTNCLKNWNRSSSKALNDSNHSKPPIIT